MHFGFFQTQVFITFQVQKLLERVLRLSMWNLESFHATNELYVFLTRLEEFRDVFIDQLVSVKRLRDDQLYDSLELGRVIFSSFSKCLVVSEQSSLVNLV